MLSAIKLLNPYVALAGLAAVLSILMGTFFYGVNVGGNSAKLACEKRVAKILFELADEKAKIEKINSDWQDRVNNVADQYNKRLIEEAKQNDELEQKVADFEQELATLPAGNSCTITQSDIDRLRGKRQTPAGKKHRTK